MATKTASKAASKTAARKSPVTKTAPSSGTTARKTVKSAAKPPATVTKKQSVAKPAKTPPTTVVTASQPVAVGNELKKRELIDLVTKRSDIKKKFAKPLVEAMLEVLGESLAEGRSLNLQPMGRVVPQRTKDAGKNRVIIARVRQSKEKVAEAAAKAKEDSVAKAAE